MDLKNRLKYILGALIRTEFSGAQPSCPAPNPCGPSASPFFPSVRRPVRPKRPRPGRAAPRSACGWLGGFLTAEHAQYVRL